jgi:hypothetical protein
MEEKNKTKQFNQEIKNQLDMLEKQTKKLDKEKQTLKEDIKKMEEKKENLLLKNKVVKR